MSWVPTCPTCGAPRRHHRGPGPLQIEVLEALVQRGPQTVRELSEWLGPGTRNIRRALYCLESRVLVRRGSKARRGAGRTPRRWVVTRAGRGVVA